jgi:hypothetical protein
LHQDRLLVFDEIDGPDGDHICEQIWHLGNCASGMRFVFSAAAEEHDSKFSPAYAAKLSGRCLSVKQRGKFPLRIAMLLTTSGKGQITTQEAANILAAYS